MSATREIFLKATPQGCRYERSGQVNTFRLFHSNGDHTQNFALYFSDPATDGDDTMRLTVSFSKVEGIPPSVQIALQDNSDYLYRPLQPSERRPGIAVDLEVEQKACDLINGKPVHLNVVPS